MFPRPTLRYIREDLKRQIPLHPLHDWDLAIIRGARKIIQKPVDQRERIVSIDDNFLAKIKVDNVRGALYFSENKGMKEAWIVAGGIRKGDSKDDDDFYTSLTRKAINFLKLARQSDQNIKSNKKTNSDWLLPREEDYKRLQADVIAENEKNSIVAIQETFKAAIEEDREPHLLSDKEMTTAKAVEYDLEMMVYDHELVKFGVRIARSDLKWLPGIIEKVQGALLKYVTPEEWYLNTSIENNDPSFLVEAYEALLESKIKFS